MKEDKRGGRKPAPVPTGHDQRAAARDHSVPHGNRKNDAIPPSKAHAPDGISGDWGSAHPSRLGSFAFGYAPQAGKPLAVGSRLEWDRLLFSAHGAKWKPVGNRR